MDKLKINLIPPEIKEKAKKEAKKTLATRISIGLLGVLILITLGTIFVVIFQGVTISSLNRDIEREKANLDSFKEKEAVAFFLKNRLDSISKFSRTQHTQTELFQLVNNLVPSGISLKSLQINKSDQILLQGDTGNTQILETFFNDLVDPGTNDDKIASVMVESLNRGSNGVINFSLSLKLK